MGRGAVFVSLISTDEFLDSPYSIDKLSSVQLGDSLLDVVVNNDLPLDGFGACEGTLACCTCHVVLSPDVCFKKNFLKKNGKIGWGPQENAYRWNMRSLPIDEFFLIGHSVFFNWNHWNEQYWKINRGFLFFGKFQCEKIWWVKLAQFSIQKLHGGSYCTVNLFNLRSWEITVAMNILFILIS